MTVLIHKHPQDYREQRPQVLVEPNVTDPIRIAFAEVKVCLRPADARKLLEDLSKAIAEVTA